MAVIYYAAMISHSGLIRIFLKNAASSQNPFEKPLIKRTSKTNYQTLPRIGVHAIIISPKQRTFCRTLVLIYFESRNMFSRPLSKIMSLFAFILSQLLTLFLSNLSQKNCMFVSRMIYVLEPLQLKIATSGHFLLIHFCF